MADLTFLKQDSTIGIVDRHIEAEGAKRPPRRYLGMSAIGDECSRRLWFHYHMNVGEQFSGRTLRLFNTGDLIEARIVKDLRKAGFKVNRGKKSNSYSDFEGMFKGHSDGIVSGLMESGKKHILEVKSANDKNFKKFQKDGIEWHDKYYAQAQLYMGYAGLERCLFVIENKNDSERIQIRVKFDMTIFKQLLEKAGDIITATAPPPGISERPDWYACKYCHLNNEEWCRGKWEGEAPF